MGWFAVNVDNKMTGLAKEAFREESALATLETVNVCPCSEATTVYQAENENARRRCVDDAQPDLELFRRKLRHVVGSCR